MWKLASIWLQNHSFLVQFSGLSVALILIHTFILPFYLFFSFSHVSLCFAWYLALHTQLPISPNTIIPSLPHPPPIAPLHHPSPSPLTPEQTAVSDRRGAWEVQPTRQANSSYLTSHLAADRHGGSVQVYTLTWSTDSPHPITVESDLSHRIKFQILQDKNLVIYKSIMKRELNGLKISVNEPFDQLQIIILDFWCSVSLVLVINIDVSLFLHYTISKIHGPTQLVYQNNP